MREVIWVAGDDNADFYKLRMLHCLLPASGPKEDLRLGLSEREQIHVRRENKHRNVIGVLRRRLKNTLGFSFLLFSSCAQNPPASPQVTDVQQTETLWPEAVDLASFSTSGEQPAGIRIWRERTKDDSRDGVTNGRVNDRKDEWEKERGWWGVISAACGSW